MSGRVWIDIRPTSNRRGLERLNMREPHAQWCGVMSDLQEREKQDFEPTEPKGATHSVQSGVDRRQTYTTRVLSSRQAST